MSCVATRLRAVRKFIKIGATRGAESQLASDGDPPVDGPELFTGHHGDRDVVLGQHLYLCGGQTAVRYKNIRLVLVFSVQ